MLTLSLIILLLSNSITLRRDRSILYSRATISILVIATLITYDSLYFYEKILQMFVDLLGLRKNLGKTKWII